MDNQLKPCPHCGGTNIHIGYDSLLGILYGICHNCWMRGPSERDYYTAQKTWNKLPRSLKMTDLKSCPACGGTNIRIGFNCLEERHYALCCDCLMRGPEKCGEDDRAITAWNSLPRHHGISPNKVDCAGCPERRDRSHAHD
mgnify:CR=1 FL=1